MQKTPMAAEALDVIVVGAGIGGLITACQLAQAGRRVVVLEQLGFVGGRFTAMRQHGTELATGAFHTFPHGNRGPIAQALRQCGAQVSVPDPQFFASFHVRGREHVARTHWQAFGVFATHRERAQLVWLVLKAKFVKHFDGSFGDWLQAQGMSPTGLALFDRFAHFALSASVFDVPYGEGRRVIRRVVDHGLPGIPMGGAREVSRQLALACARHGVEIRRFSAVQAITTQGGRVASVQVVNRRSHETYVLAATTVVSNAGAVATTQMLQSGAAEQGKPPVKPPVSPSLPAVPAVPAAPAVPAVATAPAACGIKITVLSPQSLISHDAILFCLDTQRVAGIIQATNTDPSLAPPGQHLLISHQIMRAGADWRAEVALGLQDWRGVFGAKFDACQVLGSACFNAQWPVNWAVQGHDVRHQNLSKIGLWMVGDGFKPAGYMMVEGVAKNAQEVVSAILQSPIPSIAPKSPLF